MPAAGRAQQRLLDLGPLARLLEPGLVRPPLGNGGAELVVLDRHQVLETDRVAAARDERAVVPEALAAEHGRVAGSSVLGGPVEAQLVEPLQVPRQRAARAVDVERHLALRTYDRAAPLECPQRARGEA